MLKTPISDLPEGEEKRQRQEELRKAVRRISAGDDGMEDAEEVDLSDCSR